MEQLKLTIRKQSISCDRTSLVSDTKNVYECVFEFDEEWQDYSKWAVFKQDNQVYKVLIENDRCIMPQEAVVKEGFCYIGVYGLKDDKRYPTVWTTPPVLVLLGCIDGVYPPQPTPSEWEQALEYMAKIDVAESDIETLKTDVSDLDELKVDKVEGKSLSQNDFTNALKTKLENLENYDDTELRQEIQNIKTMLGTLTNGYDFLIVKKGQ